MLSKKKGSRSTASAVASLGALLGASLAKSQQAKSKNKNQKKLMPPNPHGFQMQRNQRMVSAPRTVGMSMSATIAHKPFPVAGRAFGFTLAQKAGDSNQFVILNNEGGELLGNHFNVDPAGLGISVLDFSSFPQPLRNLATSFTRYRAKKLVATYVPLVNTGSNGNITISTTSEPNAQGAPILSYNTVSSMQNAVCTPVWSPITVNLLSTSTTTFNGLDTNWKFIDSAPDTDLAYARQSTLGTFAYSTAGVNIVGDLTVALGQIWLDYELEFEGIATEQSFYSRKISPSIQPSNTSSSSTPPQVAPTLLRENTASPGYYMVREGPKPF